MLRLTHARTNINLIFTSLAGGRSAMQRLTDMGLISGERLRILHNSGYGPVTVLIKGAKVALGYGLASKIIVKEEE